ncbi:MAG: DUF2142 domain-containing protein [Clostridia bacterium]|nr:DUF2142 domain-containing protein [Clostridia bacterium]
MTFATYKQKYGRLTAAILTAAVLLGMMLMKTRRLAGYNPVQKTAMLVELAIWGVMLIGLCAVILCHKIKRHQLFILMAAAIGLCYAFAITPMSAPDETAHYKNAVAIASGLTGGQVDANYLSLEGLTPHENTGEALHTYLTGLAGETLTGDKTDCPWVCQSYPVMYLPQVLATLLAFALHLNRMWIYLLGDLLNLALYITLTAMAIRIIPRGKTPLMLAAVTPMAMQQASSLSGDGFVIGMSFLLIALAVRAMERQGKAGRGELAAIMAVSVLMAPAKAVYFLLLLLLVLIPKERFGSNGRKWLFIAATAALAAAVTVAVQLSWLTKQVSDSAAGTTPYYSMGWVLSHPVQTVMLVINTLVPRGAFWYIDSAVGRELSGLSLQIFPGYVYFMLFLVLLSAVTSKGETPLKPVRRWSFLTIAALVVLATMGTMLIAWTPMGAAAIDGVQGRYFIPLLPLVFIAMENSCFAAQKDYYRFYGIGMLALQLVTLNEIMAIMIQNAV